MKFLSLSSLLIVAMLATSCANATSMNYIGSLQDSGKPAEGNYDFRLTLYSDAEASKSLTGAVILHQVPVHDGRFSTIAEFATTADAMRSAYLGEQVRASTSSAGFTKPDSRAVVPIGTYLGSELWFDGAAGLTDVIPAQVDCSVSGPVGTCTCKTDQYGDCWFIASVCLRKGGSWTGSSESGTCTFSGKF